MEFKSRNLGLLPERLRLSASWEPLGGSPEPPQLGPEIGGSWGSHRVATWTICLLSTVSIACCRSSSRPPLLMLLCSWWVSTKKTTPVTWRWGPTYRFPARNFSKRFAPLHVQCALSGWYHYLAYLWNLWWNVHSVIGSFLLMQRTSALRGGGGAAKKKIYIRPKLSPLKFQNRM